MHKLIIMILILGLLSLPLGALAAAAPNGDYNAKLGPECGELGDCPSSPLNCHEKCGCDRVYHYNETTGMCVLTFEHLMIPNIKVYVEYDPKDGNLENEHHLSKAIRVEAEKIFEAILISVVIFITCCTICIVSACLYCCRITYTDYVLKKDIKALARKLQRNATIKKGPKRPLPTAAGESCNIVCEDAGVFVV